MGRLNAFSLMEMMIVLLIVAIIAAATAPMVTKKLARNSNGTGGAIEFFGLSPNFGNNGDGALIIGDRTNHGNLLLGDPGPKVYIDSNRSNQAQLGFGVNGNYLGLISMQDVRNDGAVAIRIGNNGTAVGKAAIAIGDDATATGTDTNGESNAIAVGEGANAGSLNSIAIGGEADAVGNTSIAIGTGNRGSDENAAARSTWSIAIGQGAKAGNNSQITYPAESGNRTERRDNDIAIGRLAQSTGLLSVAMGSNALSSHAASIAIGNNATANNHWAVAIGCDTNLQSYNNSGITRYTAGEGSTAIGSGAIAIGNQSIAIGNGDPTYRNSNGDLTPTSPTASHHNTIAIGSGTDAYARSGIAIGNYATAGATRGIAIGGGDDEVYHEHRTRADGENGIAIGWKAGVGCTHGIAIGSAATADNPRNSAGTVIGSGTNAIAIGQSAVASAENSVSIGAGVVNNRAGVIQLGTSGHTVYIPGNLVVGRKTLLGYEDDNAHSCVLLREAQKGSTGSGHDGSSSSHDIIKFAYAPGDDENEMRAVCTDGDEDIPGFGTVRFHRSDRRLKNVGEKFKGGLAELKKLDLYNYTYKKDEKKTPQVGVMAQDLQKIFPNAVWEAKDGYLSIRWDEMFYAVINAIKELDTKIETAFEQIKANTDKIAKLQAQVDEQKQEIKELKAQNADFEKRLAKLEKARGK